jgi:pentapeptide repeat protein
VSWVNKRLSEIRVAPVRAWAVPRLEQARQWLTAPREPLTWAALRAKLTLTTLPLPRTNGGRLAMLVGVGVLLLLALLWYASGQPDDKGVVTYPHASLINPILGGLGALFLIYAAIRQARTAGAQAEIARKQAQIAADRHAAQTNADLQRRTTETFSKAVEQLGSEKMEVRVGGIYILERLAGETVASPAEEGSGPDLYWTAMETLTAFVRERARWKKPEPSAPEVVVPTPATDIAAVLEVLRRRPAAGRERETLRDWHLDLRMTDLRGADLSLAHLAGADLSLAHLEGANLIGAHLEGAYLGFAYLAGADLIGAHLEGANLLGAIGDAKTRLPTGVARPIGWPPYAP